MHQSVATIDSPEFLNLTPLDINPLMSQCEIKVLYIGQNDNGTYIDYETAKKIGKTLRGAPIVGYYKESKEDYTDHGEKIIIDDEGIHFECQTKPYGYVSPIADVWFKDFQETDRNTGKIVVRKYLMTTGFLWTGQFPQAEVVLTEGRPQSMEFDNKSVDGVWQQKNGMEFFIINDAIISKLCILGDDVEPCFEGASVTAPESSTKFTLDKDFKNTLYSMMQDLRYALEGGQKMENLENTEVTEVTEEVTVAEETQVEQIKDEVTPVAETEVEVSAEIETTEQEAGVQAEIVATEESTCPAADYEKKPEDEKKEEESDGEKSSEEDDEKKKNAEKYTALENQYSLLKQDYEKLEKEYIKLVDFKRTIDNQKKDELISEFFMLADDDKADIIKNKEKYSLEEIKAKLAVICFDKKINFSLAKQEEASIKEEKVVTYNLNDDKDSNLPDWVKAVKEQEKLK